MDEVTQKDGDILCPFCGASRDLERRGDQWFCNCCSQTWEALSEQDKQFLKQHKITPE